MKVTLDPFMHSDKSLTEYVDIAAEIGYKHLELCARDDFLPDYYPPRANIDQIRKFKRALRDKNVELASMLVTYRWSSPREEERRTAVRYWKRAIQIAVELGCETINSIFDRGPSPESCNFKSGPEMAEECEAAFWMSMEELVPLFEREQIPLHLEPHPDDFVEDNNTAVDIVRAIGSPYVKYLYCAPHTFHMGEDMEAMIRYAAPVLAHVHIADTFNHKIGWRYVINPPGSSARVHQHLNIGDGEINWDLFFRVLSEVNFDGIFTAQAFAYPAEKAMDSSRFMYDRINHYIVKYWK